MPKQTVTTEVELPYGAGATPVIKNVSGDTLLVGRAAGTDDANAEIELAAGEAYEWPGELDGTYRVHVVSTGSTVVRHGRA